MVSRLRQSRCENSVSTSVWAAVSEHHGEVLLDANDEGNVCFHREIKPLCANELAISDQKGDLVLAEEITEAADEGDARRSSSTAAAPAPSCRRSQHQDVDVGLAELPPPGSGTAGGRRH
ncbi:hypothetical protein A8M32_00255 [Sinorhizobium alkalisoli]|uniref:Uncharacterized protein n=1 Tax=Sinorhizobium alkalisoli TaxID=1752398 RepID=A0A1E3VIM0_9HYPH|nr:hypothetical protein A8M32_00255 [Sinorhizobium alkalisoli]